jgi:diguanylate cyclase (GGDEF)-like protein/PAS domain S-box-containing protein
MPRSKKPAPRPSRTRSPLDRAVARHERTTSRLRLSETLYHSLVENLPQCILRKDVRGQFTFVNRKFCEALGLMPDEILGKTDYDFYSKEMADKFRKDDIIVMETGEILETEEENKSPGQETRYVHVVKTPLRDHEGKVLGVQVLFWDVTARRRAEDALAEQVYLMDTLMDTLPDHIFFKDAEGRFLRINRALAALYGLDNPAQAVGKTDFDFYPREEAERFRRDEEEILRTGRPLVAREERKTDAAGHTVWHATTKMPIRDKAGRSVGIFGISHDIGPRKAAEATLTEQNYLLGALMDNVPDFIYFKDVQGRFIRANRAVAQRHADGDPGKLVGKTDFDLFTREHAEPAQRDEQEIMRTGRPLVAKEERETYADGTVKWVSTTKMPLRDKDGRVVGTFGVTRDITSHKRAEAALTEQAALLATLMDNVPDRIFFKDAQSRFTCVNRAQAARFGLKDPAEAVGKTDFDFFPREDAERFLRDEQAIMRTGVPMIGRVERKANPDGTAAWTSSTKLPLRSREGEIVGTFGINRDITGLKRAEEALAEQVYLLNTLLENVPDFIYFKDARGRFTRINRALAARFRLADPAHAVGKTDVDFFDRESADSARKDEEEILRTGRPLVAKEEPLQIPGGAPVWVSTTKLPLRDPEGRIVGTFGISRDITERKRAEEQLLRQAFYDPLTQLSNRALFMDRLAHRFRRLRRHEGDHFAVLFLDLDRFKGINDSLGHQAGDNLLVTVARRLESCLRPGDTVARLGGDEFTILLDDVHDVGDAVRVADRIQAVLATPCNLAGVEVFTTVSTGIALSTTRYERPEEMLRDADTAMYRAKAHGRARHEVFDATMHERAVSLLQLETDLRRAVDRGEFRLYYQPVVTVADGRLTGFEALVRWLHPQRGLIAPDTFIPLAEETGLISPIGLWVLREACRQIREWQKQFPSDPPLRVSVNVSSRQFAQTDFVEQVRRILEETGLDPATLTLEITESTIMENIKATASILGQIRALSIQLYIDDFGTGYSSLSQLHHFPIDTLKVDRSFVSRMREEKGEPAEIVRTIVSLAQNLGLNVTAEGVETAEQLEALKRLKCGSAQGYYFSEPLDAVAAETILRQGPPWAGSRDGAPPPASPPAAPPEPPAAPPAG